MHRVTPRAAVIALVAILGVVVLTAGSCSSDSPQKTESKTQQNNYAKLAAQQPSHTMGYSPTRETINFWIDTWSKPGKLSYIYLQAGNGQLIGYYIFKGLPVSYCASQTPTYRVYTSDNGNLSTPAPSIDGVYYSGGQCNSYYGRDASNNAYVEYTVGGSQNVLIYDRPLPKADVQPLAFATVENVK